MDDEMTDYYLKADTETLFWNTLTSAGVVQQVQDPDTGMPFNVPIGVSLDVIGTIYEPTGNIITDNDGYPYPEMTAVPGFHANLRGELASEVLVQLAGVLIPEPTSPVRVWA